MNHKLARGGVRILERAQSFVEFGIFLPIFLIMITGLTEFGFLLNEYLNIMDGPREAARSACDDPNLTQSDLVLKNSIFYQTVVAKALSSTAPVSLNIHAGHDDVVVSVFSVTTDQATGVNNITHRFPNDNPTFNGYYNNYQSDFADEPTVHAKLYSLLNTGSSDIPPNTGLVVVEIFYKYNLLLKLPKIIWFIPDPIPLHSYTIMPCPIAAP